MTAAGLDRTLAALAEPSRRRIIDVLGRGPRSAGDLAQVVGLSPPSVSRHLKALKDGRLVAEESPPHDARLRVYRLTPEPMAELRAWLAQTEQLWADQLAAFKAHLEGEGAVSSRVVVAIRVRATPERAFDVFTRDISLWWRPSRLFQLTAAGDGRLRFEGGEGGRLISEAADGAVFEVGRIRAWRPGEQLVFGWRQSSFAPGMDTEVEVRFQAVDDETRVTVEHRGWDSVPADHVARHGFPQAIFLHRQAEQWRDGLRALNREAVRRE